MLSRFEHWHFSLFHCLYEMRCLIYLYWWSWMIAFSLIINSSVKMLLVIVQIAFVVDYIIWNYWLLSYGFCFFLSFDRIAMGCLNCYQFFILLLFCLNLEYPMLADSWYYLCLLMGRILILSSIFKLLQFSVLHCDDNENF